jgi:hypothetical protein
MGGISGLSPLLGAGLALATVTCVAQTFDDGGGAFGPAQLLPVASGPYAPVAADLNGDGRLDLVVGNTDSDSVQILLGDGAGGFGSPSTLAAGDGTEGVTVADLNGDGKPDLVAANLFASTLSIFLGNGSGGFALTASPTVGANPHAVVVADFNGDGKPDLATANGSAGTTSILLGNGGGAFSSSVDYSSGANPRDIATADFNGDGKRDLVITNEGDNSLSILPGSGIGGFGAPATYPAGAAPQTVAVGDLDGDGKPDVVVPSTTGGKVVVYAGVGNGTLAAKPEIDVGHAVTAASLRDLDGDGKLDLIIARGDPTLEVRLGLGNGTFGPATGVGPGGLWNRIALADLNADGKLDMVGSMPSWYASDLLVSLNTSELLHVAPSAKAHENGSYNLRRQPIWIDRQAPGPYPASYFSHAGYADIDRDGDVDVLRTFSNNADTFPVQILVNDGSGNFSDQTASRIIGSQPGLAVPRKILTGDYNGDGWPDFFISPHGLDTPPYPGEAPQLFLSNGDGTLHYEPGLESQVGFHHGAASADVDGNGTVDILVGDAPSYLLLNDGAAHFTVNTSRLPTRADGNAFFFFTAELADVDGDGYVDLLTAGHEHENIPTVIYWGGENGLYRSSRSTTLPSVPDMGICLDFIIEDIDHDGRRDVVVNRTGSTQDYVGRYFQILRQTAPRVFADESAARVTMDKTLRTFDFFRGQDINADGHVDILIDDRNEMTIGEYAWVNNGAGVFTPYAGPITLKGAPTLAVSDASVSEGNAGSKVLSFSVSVSPTSEQAVSFDAFTAPGTATPGVDYQNASVAGLSIPAGQASVQVPVTINGDTAVEGHETFTLNLTNAVNAAIRDGQGRGRIVNDDLAGLSIRDAAVSEGNDGSTTLAFAIELSSPMPSPVTFDIATGGGTATAGTDYVARSQVGRFMDAGRTRQWFEVAVKGDTAVESSETFIVTISNASGAVLQDGSATGTIGNDDAASLRATRARPAAASPRGKRPMSAREPAR